MSVIVITIWGNSQFGCELASYLCKYTAHNVAVFDADLLCPSADLYMGVSKSGGGLPSLIPLYDEDKIDPKSLRNSCVNPVERLYILTGSYMLENYEYYTMEIFKKVTEELRNSFDIVIHLVNKNIYDLFTILSLYNSDINIAPIESNIQTIREYNTYIAFIKKKQDIPPGKTKFVSYNYNSKVFESKYIMDELTDGNFLGKISFSLSRDHALKAGKPCYKYLDDRNTAEYAVIANRLGINCQSENKKKRVF